MFFFRFFRFGTQARFFVKEKEKRQRQEGKKQAKTCCCSMYTNKSPISVRTGKNLSDCTLVLDHFHNVEIMSKQKIFVVIYMFKHVSLEIEVMWNYSTKSNIKKIRYSSFQCSYTYANSCDKSEFSVHMNTDCCSKKHILICTAIDRRHE